MTWKLIHIYLLCPSDSFMKAMCHHQTINGLTKKCPNKLNQAKCAIFYTAKITTSPQGTTVDTINLQPG